MYLQINQSINALLEAAAQLSKAAYHPSISRLQHDQKKPGRYVMIKDGSAWRSIMLELIGC
jgi:hypothetical protein